MNIWVVSVGEYSNYNVCGLFDDEHKGKAEEFAERIRGRVEDEPLILNPEHQEPPPGQTFFIFHMEKDGTTKVISEDSILTSDGALHNSSYSVHHIDGDWFMVVRVYARDEKHAVKIANEVRTQILAGDKPEQGSLGVTDASSETS